MNASARMTNHWSRIREVASLLDIDKMLVHQHWTKLKQEATFPYEGDTDKGPLIDFILNKAHRNHAVACEYVKRNVIVDYQPKLFEPEESPKPKTVTEALSLAFWFIKKVGDVDLAQKAMDAAIYAHRRMMK